MYGGLDFSLISDSFLILLSELKILVPSRSFSSVSVEFVEC